MRRDAASMPSIPPRDPGCVCRRPSYCASKSRLMRRNVNWDPGNFPEGYLLQISEPIKANISLGIDKFKSWSAGIDRLNSNPILRNVALLE